MKDFSGDREMYGNENDAPLSVCCFCRIISSAAYICIRVVRVLVQLSSSYCFLN